MKNHTYIDNGKRIHTGDRAGGNNKTHNKTTRLQYTVSHRGFMLVVAKYIQISPKKLDVHTFKGYSWRF